MITETCDLILYYFRTSVFGAQIREIDELIFIMRVNGDIFILAELRGLSFELADIRTKIFILRF